MSSEINAGPSGVGSAEAEASAEKGPGGEEVCVAGPADLDLHGADKCRYEHHHNSKHKQ